MQARSRCTVRLSLACNNHCRFCAQEGLASLGAPDPREALRAGRQTTDEVTLTGGEPTLVDGVEDIIAYAREIGFSRVGLQTNAHDLKATRLEQLLGAGLTDLHLSIHGATACVHDYHVGVVGAFESIVQTMQAAARMRVPVVVTTVLTRSNARVLSGVPRLLQQQRVMGWMIRIARVAGRAAARFDATVPRLAMAIPSALHAMHLARRLRLPVFLDGAPLCLLGPYATRAITGDGLRAYPNTCSSCQARVQCPGFDPKYLDRFRGDEAAVAGAPDLASLAARPGPEAILRMFVGIGELSLTPETKHQTTTYREARHALPVLS